jgi:hypothetical protein
MYKLLPPTLEDACECGPVRPAAALAA